LRFFTGLRPSEEIALVVTEYDRRNGVLSVTKARVNGTDQDVTKTREDRRRTASIVYVDSPATLINIRNRTATSASTITLAVQIRTSHPMRRGQEAVRTEGCSTIS
jgi:hypothetical protein